MSYKIQEFNINDFTAEIIGLDINLNENRNTNKPSSCISINDALSSLCYNDSNVEIKLNNYYNGNSLNVGDKFHCTTTYVQGLACAKITVIEGDKFIYNGRGTAYVRSYIIVNDLNVITRISNSDVSRKPIELTIEHGESTLYVSFNNYDSTIDYLKKLTKLKDITYTNTNNIQSLTNNVNTLYKNVNTLDVNIKMINNSLYPSITLSKNKYYNGSSLNIGDEYTKQAYEYEGSACAKIEVNEGDIFIYKGIGTEYIRSYIITDSNNKITQLSYIDIKRTDEIEIKINNDEKTLYISFQLYDEQTDYIKRIYTNNNMNIHDKINDICENLDTLNENAYKNIDLYLNCYYKSINYNIGDVYNESTSIYDNGACIKLTVNTGEHYLYKGKVSTYVIPYIITDANGVITRIKTITDSEWGDYYNEIIIESNEKNLYCSFNNYNPDEHYLKVLISTSNENSSKMLYGKNIVCFGDSITEFTNNGKSVTDYIKELSGANVTNVAIGGTRLSQRYEPIPSNPNNEWTSYAAHDLTAIINSIILEDYSQLDIAANWLKDNVGDNNTAIIERLKNINWNNIDIVTIFIGTNDYAGDTQIGIPDNENVQLIKGSVNYIIKSLLTKYPHLKIYWFTPIPRWMCSTLEDRIDENWAGNKQNSIGKTLIDYVDSIIEQCKLQCIPVCDMYRTIGWNKYNLGHYLVSSGTDGVHPFNGFKQIAEKMISFMISN